MRLSACIGLHGGISCLAVVACARAPAAPPAAAIVVQASVSGDSVPITVQLTPVESVTPTAFPTQFDPAGQLLATCLGDTCGVWERGPTAGYRGSVPARRCAGWWTRGPDPNPENPTKTEAITVSDGFLSVRDLRNGVSRPLSESSRGCAPAAAWSADDRHFAVRCGSELRVFNLRSGQLEGRTDMLPGTGFQYAWHGALVVAPVDEQSPDGIVTRAILTWPIPGKPTWAAIQASATQLVVALDPVVGGAWLSIDVAGGGGCDVRVATRRYVSGPATPAERDCRTRESRPVGR